MRNHFIWVILTLAVGQTASADPCNYLDRSTCLKESYYCAYTPAQYQKGTCRAINGGIDSVCRTAHILDQFGEKMVRDECYKKMAITDCEWTPGYETVESCEIRPRFKPRRGE